MPPSARNTGNAGAYAVGVCILVADFEFGTEPAEVIADDAVDVEALLVFDRHRVRCCAKVEIGVLDDHTAALDTDIPGAVTCLGCGCERSEEHTSELQSLMRISYAGFCLKKKKKPNTTTTN